MWQQRHVRIPDVCFELQGKYRIKKMCIRDRTYTPQNRRRKGRLTTQWRTGIMKSMRDRAIEDYDWKDR